MKGELERLVRERADGRCEYCRSRSEDFGGLSHQIDHIIAKQHGGQDDLGNLALACSHCNLLKGPNVAGISSSSGRAIRLFDPRRDTWARHFTFRGDQIVGLTERGRITVSVLQLNAERMVQIRRALIEEGEEL